MQIKSVPLRLSLPPFPVDLRNKVFKKKFIRFFSEHIKNCTNFALNNKTDMEVEFREKYLRELYETGKTTDKKHRFQPQIINGYLKCVKALDEATRMEDLFGFNALHYEKLSGDKKGLSSLRINDQYRLEFLELANLDDKSKIEICALTNITSHYK